MAIVYILYTVSAEKFYIRSTLDLNLRLQYHHEKEFRNSFKAKCNDWEQYLTISVNDNTIARKVELHIKKIESKTYINNLKRYPEMIQKLILKYSI
jgi:putative endonuclease